MNGKLRAWRDLGVCLLIMAVLISAGQHFPQLDMALRIAWIGLLVTSVWIVVWRSLRSQDTRPVSHPFFWMPRRWQQWIFYEEPGEKREPSNKE